MARLKDTNLLTYLLVIFHKLTLKCTRDVYCRIHLEMYNKVTTVTTAPFKKITSLLKQHVYNVITMKIKIKMLYEQQGYQIKMTGTISFFTRLESMQVFLLILAFTVIEIGT